MLKTNLAGAVVAFISFSAVTAVTNATTTANAANLQKNAPTSTGIDPLFKSCTQVREAMAKNDKEIADIQLSVLNCQRSAQRCAANTSAPLNKKLVLFQQKHDYLKNLFDSKMNCH